MDLLIKSLVGFVVGALIGMTGVGGGVLLLPILIFGLGVPPMLAVGSDALFNFVTKIGASASTCAKAQCGSRWSWRSPSAALRVLIWA